MTATAIQAPVPKVDVQQDVPQIQAKPTQSFREVMQAQQTQKQSAAQKTTAQKPGKEATVQQSANQAADAAQKSQAATAEETVVFSQAADMETVENPEEIRAEALQGVFTGLFGPNVAGIDYTQSDQDILKDLLSQCRDPEQQFAIMLMMAFLQANPDYTLEDLAGEIAACENQPAVTGSSPVAAVLNAIERMMTKDENIEGFPLLDEAHALLKTASPQKSQFLALMQMLNTESAAYTKEQTAQSDPQEALLLQGKLYTAVEQAKQGLTGGQRKDESATDIERLQQQVDAGVFLRGANVFTAKTGTSFFIPTAPEFVQQVRTGILSNLSVGANSEFVLRLKPDGLGELTVKLTEAAGKMTLTIAASNAQTQRMLEAQLPNLREVMKPYEVEVGPIISGKEDAAARFGGAFGEQFGNRQQPDEQSEHGGAWHGGTQDEAAEAPVWNFQETETIDTYI